MDDYEVAQPEATDPLAELQKIAVRLVQLAELDNAAEAFDEDELGKIGSSVVQEFKLDEASREDWEQSARRAMDIAKQIRKPKSTPWEGASNVRYPLLTVAAMQFAARAYPALIDGADVVKVAVKGADPDGIKAARAERVSAHMSYQLLYEMASWEDDVDTLLHQIPIVGCAFKKVYPDPMSDTGSVANSELVSAFDVVVNQKARNFQSVPRITHIIELYPYEVIERQRDGRFLDVELAMDVTGEDAQKPQRFLEQHRLWDSDGDGMSEPWIVTVHESSMKVVRLVAGYDVEKIRTNPATGKIARIPKRTDIRFVCVPFLPDPDGGVYPIGFGRLLESISDVVDTTINQMMDAGTLQNAGGGFIGSGLKLGKSKIVTAPGLWQNVEANGADIRAAMVAHQHPGPAPVLFQLLGMMIEAGKDISAIKDVTTGDTGGKTMTATTTMALIEQGLKVFSAIFKRILRAFGDEFEVIYEINRKYLDGQRYVMLLDNPIAVGAEDYADNMDIMPVADPNNITDMQRAARAEFLLGEVRNGNPFIDPMAATRRALEAMRIENVEEVLAKPQEGPSPADEVALAEGQAKADKTRADAVKTGAEAIRLQAENAMMGLPVELPPDQPMGMQPPPPEEMAPDGMPMDPMQGDPGMGVPMNGLPMSGEMGQEMPVESGMQPMGPM